MNSVLFLVGSVSATSIPTELASSIAEKSKLDVTIVSFYDNEIPSGIPMIDEVEVTALGANSRFDKTAFYNLWRILCNRSIDVLHTHDNFLGSIGRILGRFANLSIVNTEHRTHDSMTSLQVLANMPTLPLSDIIITNSQATLDSFTRMERILLRITNTERAVVYNGVNISRVRSAKAADIEGGPVVVCAARFVSIKNHKTLVRAFAKVSEDIPRARLILAGDGPQRSTVEMLVESLELRDKIQFVGSVSRNRVYELYAGADAFVIASYAEGFCVAAVEALAAGLPIIASDIPALREVLDDAALFADPDDPDSFKMQLKKVLTMPDLAAQLSSTGSKHAKQFSLEQAAREYLNIYMQLGTRTDSRANLI